MMKTLTIKAPAKINLTLEVVGRRPDGFHEIKSVMQTIGLNDSLRIEPGTGIEYICHDPVWQPEKSLVPRAVNLLRESTGTTRGALIGINKRIPLVSGLGGESSLAAAVSSPRSPSQCLSRWAVLPSTGHPGGSNRWAG